MKLSKKFMEHTNHVFTRDYDPEWIECDHLT